MKFLFFLCIVPLFRYAEVQIDTIPSSYPSQFRLNLACFAGKPYLSLFKDYLVGDVYIEIRKVNTMLRTEGPPLKYEVDVEMDMEFTEFRKDKTTKFFLNVDPDSYYKIKIYRKGVHFWRWQLSSLGKNSEYAIEYSKYYKQDNREPNMILHIR